MRKALTDLPAIVPGFTAAKGKFCGDSPSGSATTFCRFARAFGPQIPIVTYLSVTSVTVTSKPSSAATRRR